MVQIRAGKCFSRPGSNMSCSFYSSWIFFINRLRISTIVVAVNVFLLFLFFVCLQKYAGYVRSHQHKNSRVKSEYSLGTGETNMISTG